MSARRRYFERPPGRHLTGDVGQIAVVGPGVGRERPPGRSRRCVPVAEYVGRLGERRDEPDLEAWHECCFRAAVLWQQQCESMPLGGKGHREYATRRLDRPVEGELADDQKV